jgi:E3 ubiquitin ligase
VRVTWTSWGTTSQWRWIAPVAAGAIFTLTMVKRAFPSGGGDVLWLLDLAAAVVAGFGVRYGFRQLREKNMVENVPSSPIRSVAMGLSEIKGHAPASAPLTAPHSGVACHYFRYRVEEERSGNRGSKEWVTIDQGASNLPFQVEDPTGRIVVDPTGAEILLQRDFQRTDAAQGWFGRRKRYSEWRIDPSEFVYVIGTVAKRRDAATEQRERLQERLRQAKRDPDAVRRFDIDGSGALDEQEWAGAVAVIKDEMMREELARGSAAPEDDLVVGAGETESTFVISDRDERSVAASLGRRALAGVLLGGAGTLVMVISILGRFGVLPGGWSFPWESLFR